ncbi:TerC family protein [Limoniibacter endophyticus]|nr:TerC family protein [Limoniibacter endophyticus]
MDIFTSAGLWAFFQVIMIDLVLAADNAIVIGLAVAGLPDAQRKKAILVGILAATFLRICFAIATVYLLSIVGLQLLGGLLLCWVCWKMWTELQSAEGTAALQTSQEEARKTKVEKTFGQAAMQIVIADLSMSLDNVLAVAGAAREHPTVLIAGLVVSIALMGLAANFIAQILHRFRWIAYVGLAVIVIVALRMLYHGGVEISPYLYAWLGL